MITKETLVVLENELTFTRRVNRSYDDQFARSGAKIGDTINIRKPVRYVGRRTATLNIEGSVDTAVPLTLNTQYGTDMAFTSAEMALSLDEFSERIIKPAVANISNMIDYDGLAQYVNVYNTVGTPGTTPTTLLTYLNAGVKLDNEAAPMGDRCIVVNPIAQATIVNALTTIFNPQKEISAQYIKGSMGSAVGFDWYMDQNVGTQVIGTYTGTPTMNGAAVQGATTLVTNGWTAGDILNQGDVFTIAGVYAVNPQNRTSTGQLRQFVCTAKQTADGSGNMTIPIQPALIGPVGGVSVYNQTISVLPASGALTIYGASATSTPQNLAFCKDAFAFATVDLPEMPGVECSRATSKKLGMSIRLMRGTDMTNDRAINRLDLLGGWATIRPELACRICG
jgi:hypothetical protein